MILITTVAREQLKKMLSGDVDNRLRIEIHSGGCNGFEKRFSIAVKNQDDAEIDNLVVVDPDSQGFLENAILDFKTDISSYGFRVSIPDASSNCGCGKSFSI